MVISADFSHKSQLCSTSYRPYLGLPALLRCDNEKEKKVLIYSEILDFQTFSCYEGNVVLSLSAINSIFHLMSLFLISPFYISIFHHFQCTFTYELIYSNIISRPTGFPAGQGMHCKYQQLYVYQDRRSNCMHQVPRRSALKNWSAFQIQSKDDRATCRLSTYIRTCFCKHIRLTYDKKSSAVSWQVTPVSK